MFCILLYLIELMSNQQIHLTSLNCLLNLYFLYDMQYSSMEIMYLFHVLCVLDVNGNVRLTNLCKVLYSSVLKRKKILYNCLIAFIPFNINISSNISYRFFSMIFFLFFWTITCSIFFKIIYHLPIEESHAIYGTTLCLVGGKDALLTY